MKKFLLWCFSTSQKGEINGLLFLVFLSSFFFKVNGLNFTYWICTVAHSWWEEEEYYACRGVARSSSKIVKSIIFIPLFASISQKTLSSLSVAVSEYLACSISIWKPWSFRKKIAAHMRWSLWVNSVFPRSHTKTNARCSASAYLKSFMEFFTPFFLFSVFRSLPAGRTMSINAFGDKSV